MLRRHNFLVVLVGLLLIFLALLSINSLTPSQVHPVSDLLYEQQVESSSWFQIPGSETGHVDIHGGVIMKELGNQTLREELGRATWRLLHTMVARFPIEPSTDEQKALKGFIYLLSRLFPCGQWYCKLLKENPPDVSSREAASKWACKAHNIVNLRLNKPIFDCSQVLSVYKCGCADETPKEDQGPGMISAKDIRRIRDF